MTDLGTWLQQRASMPRQPCVQDCCTFPCDWAVESGLADPMAAWRGTYETAAEAQALMNAAGGLLALFEQGFAAIPRRHGDPVTGDVGLIRFGELEAGAIFTGRRWAFVGERGVGMASIEPEFVVAVWAVGHG